MSLKDADGEKHNGHHHHHHHHHPCRHKFYRRLFGGLLAFVVLFLFIVLIVYLVLRPTKPRFFLRDVAVVALNLSGNPPVAYLTTTVQITVSTRNPNDRIGIYYGKLDVYAAYKYQQVTLATAIPPTYQGHNDVVVWSPFLYGVNVPLDPYLAMAASQDQSAGLTLLYVKMSGRLRWKVGSWTSGHYRISVNCPALLGSDVNGISGGVYRFQQASACAVDV